MNKEFQRLAIRFRQQEEFSTGYSPLYALLFRLVADWLEAPGAAADPAVNWLVEAGRGRDSLTVTLLLAAGLHRDVLVGEGRVEDLASYYPSAGGLRFPDEPGFESALRQAIHAQRESLKTFIRSANVQTNETGRGLCWLLPVLSSGWQAVQLVDLGASAGLNLVAERRAYRLQEAGSERYLADLGTGWPPQFMVRCQGDVDPISRFGFRHVPRITGRIGCDIIPFPLVTEDDALTLEAFIWADQVTRIQRLREGIQAYRQVERSAAPVKIYQANLPDDVNRFLHDRVPDDPSVPVVITNTWMTSYLGDKGQSLMVHLDQWAADQQRPVLWLQWEPPRDGSLPPVDGWCAWTADLWQGQTHRRWLLGWAHPHGLEVAFGPGMADWLKASPIAS